MCKSGKERWFELSSYKENWIATQPIYETGISRPCIYVLWSGVLGWFCPRKFWGYFRNSPSTSLWNCFTTISSIICAIWTYIIPKNIQLKISTIPQILLSLLTFMTPSPMSTYQHSAKPCRTGVSPISTRLPAWSTNSGDWGYPRMITSFMHWWWSWK